MHHSVKMSSMINYFLLSVVILLLRLSSSFTHATLAQERKVYIVYMGEVPTTPQISALDHQHHNLLLSATQDESIATSAKLYSYTRSFNGFAARLLPEEADRIRGRDGVVSVFESQNKQLHTTRSWDFLGMPHEQDHVGRKPGVESDIIVGLLDTGIYPDAPSFNASGFGPPPAKWKGRCDSGQNFTGCNNKVIGARFYTLDHPDPSFDVLSPADFNGHGSHTSSTAAGVAVQGASLYGIAEGTARGGVPSARIAMYKVCWRSGCADANLMAAFDDAIADGVDVISLSIGGSPNSFHSDPIAIGAFHAMKKGILVSCSAGNVGPSLGSVQNVAPWILTVAASSIDRQFKTAVKLANGVKSAGISINTFSPERAMYPLTNGIQAAINASGNGNASACNYGTLDAKKVKGKIVFCRGNVNQDSTISEIEGVGAIMTTTELSDIASTTIIPGVTLMVDDGEKIDKYINTTKYPRAVIERTRTVLTMSAPAVASFSSRGPQFVSPSILKPDVAAPGLSILAAYSTLATVTGGQDDSRRSLFNILSGTSMSCPHVAATAAYVKSFHPSWSPAMIKSAIMTTATPIKIPAEGEGLATGSGVINPTRAIHPGLVYDISVTDYISYLCNEGYSDADLNLLYHGRNNVVSCANIKPAKGSDGLNYPSMHYQLNNSMTTFSVEFHRTVKYVGVGSSVYTAKVSSPEGVAVEVVPEKLEFNRKHQKESFKICVSGELKNGTNIATGSLVWNDGKHVVLSPIVVYKRHF